jgi:thioredoxin-related protein
MKSFKLTVIIILLFGASSIFAQDNGKIKFDSTRNPEKDLEETLKEAQKTNRRILLNVGGEWCIWCHRIDEFIEKNPEIKDFLNKKFIVLKVNFSEENKNEKFLSQYPKVEGYPHFFVLSKKGKLLQSQNTGLLEKDKSYDAEKFMKFLKKWAAKK